jgi:hypothetical protein
MDEELLFDSQTLPGYELEYNITTSLTVDEFSYIEV